MKGYVSVISPKGIVAHFNLGGDEDQILRTLQMLVGGELQQVQHWDTWTTEEGATHRVVVFVDEEGMNKGRQVNVLATADWRAALKATGQYREFEIRQATLYGPAAIVYGDEEFMESL